MKLGAAILVVILSIPVLSPIPVRAADAPGCEGLTAFREELFPIGERWAAELREIGIGGPDWSPATLSSDDWLAYAEISIEVHRALKAVDAPDWAQAWLDVRIDRTALQEQIGKAVAIGGLLLALGFDAETDMLDQRDTETRDEAIERCADFEQFAYDWDALDGEVDGTPVAA